jgi:acyl-coenzyme A thioesterase PaaI-like protein
MNSMGALQGGVVGVVVEAAAEAALRHAAGAPLVVTDLQLTYLAFGRVGPLRTETEVLACTPEHGVARVALFDTGAESRQMSVARVVATRSLT